MKDVQNNRHGLAAQSSSTGSTQEGRCPYSRPKVLSVELLEAAAGTTCTDTGPVNGKSFPPCQVIGS